MFYHNKYLCGIQFLGAKYERIGGELHCLGRLHCMLFLILKSFVCAYASACRCARAGVRSPCSIPRSGFGFVSAISLNIFTNIGAVTSKSCHYIDKQVTSSSGKRCFHAGLNNNHQYVIRILLLAGRKSCHK